MTQPIPQGYKQTEIGVIPEDWEVAAISDRHVVATGSTPPTADPTNYGQDYLFVSPADLGDKKYIIETEKKLSPKGFLISRKYPAGSTLFTCIGSTIGKTGYATIEMTSNQQINAVFPSDIECPEFSYYALTSIANRIKELAGEQAVPLVNKTDFEKTKYCYPRNKPEQTAIATALSDVDALISGLESLIAKKQAIKTATMQQLLTGKTRLPQFAHHPDGTAKGYQQTELGLVPEDWGVERIGQNCQTYSGGTPLTSNKSFYGGDIFWVTSSDLNKKIIFEVDGRITESGLYYSSAKMVKSGTFLIALYGATAGVCAISMIDAAINQAVLAVVPSCHKSEYLYYWFTKNKDEIIETYTQGGQPNLSGDIIRSIKIPFPSLEEQTAIATILSDMDEEIQALETRLNKTKQIKQGMMQVLLTGKVRLV